MRKLLLLILTITWLFISSCFKKDKPLALPVSTGTSIATFSLGTNYTRSYFFDLDTHDTLEFNNNCWDMAFQCAADSFHIYINGENQAFLRNLGQIDFTSVTYADTAGRLSYPSKWRFDASSWRSDSTAFGNWLDISAKSKHEVFVLFRGGHNFTSGVRYRKLYLDKPDARTYTVTFANMDGTDAHTLTITKDITKNLVYANLADSGKELNIDQNKMDFDIQFTRYRYIYYYLHPEVFYTLTGALINMSNTYVAVDSLINFSSINKNNFSPGAYTYSNARDVIGGFGWKKYNFTTSHYDVNPKYVYIIKNKAGHYFKLHFIDFYDINGNKGTPKFEYERVR